MKGFVFGNGASVACGQHTAKDWLFRAMERIKSLSSDPVICNSQEGIRNGLTKLLQRLDELRGCIKGNPRGLYYPQNSTSFQLYMHNQLSGGKAKTARKRLKKVLNSLNISIFVEEIFSRAYDKKPYVFHSFVQKRSTLLGPHAGNFLEQLEDLQRNVTGFAMQEVQKPTLYQRFAKILPKDEPVLIINLNWDTLFESAFRQEMQSEPKHIYLSGAIRNRSGLPESRSCLLSKPHGSLEYLCCRSSVNASWLGCYRLSVTPGLWTLPMTLDASLTCLHDNCAGTGHPLRPFLHPYNRMTSSRMSIPFVCAALEALKPYLRHMDDIVIIGYSFGLDNVGWIDEDLLPVFIGKSLRLVDSSRQKAAKLARQVKAMGFQNVQALPYCGFDDYLQASESQGRLI